MLRSLFDALFPHYSYRRLMLAGTFRSIRTRQSPIPRLSARNWSYFQKYAGAQLDCNICGKTTRAFFDFPDLHLRREHRIGELRETVQCSACGATMRHRTLAAALLRVASARAGRPLLSLDEAHAAGLADMKILDTDSFSPIAARLRDLPNYYRSSFLPDRVFGEEIEPNRFNINLERISFADSTFDVLLTSDVAEHIRDIEAAHREIARVLKPGGAYVFTVPYDPNSATHHVLVDTTGPEDVFLVPKQIHGDPLTGGVVAYRVFGRAILEDLASVGLQAQFLCMNSPEMLIIDGDVFVARRVVTTPGRSKP